ncbi:MAG: hypothetical protein NVSMB42_16940 [Herpetosiphon sp.]
MQQPARQNVPAQDVDGQQTLHRFIVFWTLVLYAGLALSVYTCFVERPAVLYGWPGVGLFGLIAAFCGMYHGLYLRSVERWPMPFRYAMLYAGGQTLLLGLLSRIHPTFAWLSFALLGHISSVVTPRRWLLPMGAVLLVLGGPTGFYAAMSQRHWLDAGSVVFTFVIIVASYLFTHLMITQRFRLERIVGELQEAKQELENQATQVDELAALRERTRLAREMHDSLGHALVLVNVKLEAAQRLYAVDAGRGEAELKATRELVRDTMNELRHSLSNLRSPLPDTDLCGALKRLVDDVKRRSKLEITCDSRHDLPPLAHETVKTVWLIAREALTNVERHANAQHVTVNLTMCDQTLVLQVWDDGIGLSLANLNRVGHYGITGMRERAEAIDGTLRVGSRPEGGTMVEARVSAVPAMSHHLEQSVESH